MDYVPISRAREMEGLRLVLTAGVPGPWGEAAKAILHVKGIPFTPVAQDAGGANEELVAWTGHANAPTAVWNDEPPRAGREEILFLAERLAPDPPLLPAEAESRALVRGLSHEIAGRDGFGWCRRLSLIAAIPAEAQGPAAAIRSRLGGRYGFSEDAAEDADRRCAEILGMLALRLRAQREDGSDYFVGDSLTAVDLYWATFAALAQPLPAETNPMPAAMRAAYGSLPEATAAALDPILLEHRDRIYQRHLELPLDF